MSVVLGYYVSSTFVEENLRTVNLQSKNLLNKQLK